MTLLDGIPVSALLANYTKGIIGAAGLASFWSTPERAQSDPMVEVLEVNLNGERLLNHLSFKLARFPHLVSAEWWDREVGAWEPLRGGDIAVEGISRYQRLLLEKSLSPTEQGEPLLHQIADSVPVRVGTADLTAADSSTLLTEHPQHHGTDHWVPVSWKTAPVTTSRVRLLLVRGPGVPPARVTGGAAAYSLAVKDLSIGYRVNSKADVPSVAEVTGVSFGSSLDLLGSPVSFSMRAQQATGVLSPGEGVAWRSEPQPVNYAVVNFYVDTRTGPQDLDTGQPVPGDPTPDNTAAGQGQVIDRFFIDPLTVGAHVNLYYSNDEPTGEFKALDEPVPFPISTEHGSILTGSLDPSTNRAGVIEYSDSVATFTDVDNTYLQFNPRKAWWLGLDLLSRTDGLGMAGGIDDHPWFSFGGNTLRQIGSTIEFVTATGKVASLDIDEGHMINAPFRVVVAFNPDPVGTHTERTPKGLTLGYQFADREPVFITRDANADDIVPGLGPKTVSIGRYNDATAPGVPALGMRVLVLKTEKPVEHDHLLDFFEFPDGFARRPDSRVLDLGLTDNALLRAHPLVSVPGVNPAGLLGGPGDRYAEMTWTPIHRDYVLRKGFLHVPPTRAKYWKFEFTQLVAEHYESFVPIRREVKLFPSKTIETHLSLTSGRNWSPKNPGTPGIRTALDLTDVNRYADAVGLLRESAVDSSVAHTATEALTVPDPARAAEIAKLGWVWSYQPWHIGSSAPRFVHTQRHEYEKIVVDHSTKIGFFAGLKALRAYRLDYLVDDDTEQYDEHFHDRVNIDSSSEVLWGENRVSTYSSAAEVVSKPLSSKRPVRGLQFATVQSDAYPLLPDDGFRDRDLLKHWRAYGDADIRRLDDRTVRVNRGWNERTYGEMETEAAFDTYGEMEGHRYAELEGNLPNGLAGGGLSSEPITPSASGRVYAAVRVASSATLSGPVSLEIVSVDGDAVLASAERSVTAGQEEVFHIGYQVGSAVEGLTYADMESGAETRTDVYQPAGGRMQFDFGVRVTTPESLLQLAQADGVALTATTDYTNVRYVDATSTVLLVDTTASIPTGTQIVATLNIPHTYGFLDGTTYASHEARAINGDVYARVVQQGRFADEFLVKRLSVFDAAMTWEFSNDDGVTWWDGTDIRNNPEGVLTFPALGTKLRWRMRSFHANASVSALSIRPWYGGLFGAVPGRAANNVLGPNHAVVDDYPDIHRDPMWQQSDSPIPSYWYQSEAPEPVYVPPPPPVETDPGYYLESQSLLLTANSGSGMVTSDSAYPFGPAATAILDDGTMFVAVQMFPTGGGGTSFIRMWHLDATLNVLGVHDEPLLDPSDVYSIALGVEGNKVFLLADTDETIPESGRMTLASAQEGWWNHILTVSTGDMSDNTFSLTPIAADANHTVTGTSPVLSSDDTTTYLSRTSVATDTNDQLMGVRLGPWTAPAGQKLARLELTYTARLDSGVGTPASYTFNVGVETTRGSRRVGDNDYAVSGAGYTPAVIDTWVRKDFATITDNTGWLADRLGTGDLVVGAVLSKSTDQYTIDMSFVQVVAVMIAA